jgi:hypothetical protein
MPLISLPVKEIVMITFERRDIKNINWDTLYEYEEHNVFQTLDWINFLIHTQNAEPVIVLVKCDGRKVGYLLSLIVNKYGLKILGSPFRGWSTYFMGLILSPHITRHEVLQALPDYAFNELDSHYIEIIDPCLKYDQFVGLPYKVEHLPWYSIDLRKSEEELLANMKHSGRNCIRKSIKEGVVIEEAADISFAEEYYAQYSDVLKRRSLVPTYSFECVRYMISNLLPTGNILLLRAKNSAGKCIATGIFLAKNTTGVFWGAASWRNYQSLRPNEPLAWYGMQKLKAIGIQDLHFGGECEQYKEKLGCSEANVYRIMKAKNALAGRLIDIVSSQKNTRFKNWVLRKL